MSYFMATSPACNPSIESAMLPWATSRELDHSWTFVPYKTSIAAMLYESTRSFVMAARSGFSFSGTTGSWSIHSTLVLFPIWFKAEAMCVRFFLYSSRAKVDPLLSLIECVALPKTTSFGRCRLFYEIEKEKIKKYL